MRLSETFQKSRSEFIYSSDETTIEYIIHRHHHPHNRLHLENFNNRARTHHQPPVWRNSNSHKSRSQLSIQINSCIKIVSPHRSHASKCVITPDRFDFSAHSISANNSESNPKLTLSKATGNADDSLLIMHNGTRLHEKPFRDKKRKARRSFCVE